MQKNQEKQQKNRSSRYSHIKLLQKLDILAYKHNNILRRICQVENLENPMVLPEYEYRYEHIPDEVWADMESNDYDDMVFEEMTED